MEISEGSRLIEQLCILLFFSFSSGTLSTPIPTAGANNKAWVDTPYPYGDSAEDQGPVTYPVIHGNSEVVAGPCVTSTPYAQPETNEGLPPAKWDQTALHDFNYITPINKVSSQ